MDQQKKFDVKVNNEPEIDKFLKALQHRLISLDKYPHLTFSLREPENLLCKVFRFCNFNSNDVDWCDTIPLFASLYRYSTSGDLTVLHVDGRPFRPFPLTMNRL
mmetsp:Transcript_5487/g.8409  ORF Transcript_5487/g.8409 Transcript_5487/m.8409 type:complete len:104 (-) Transcript_5487:285-596(-)